MYQKNEDSLAENLQKPVLVVVVGPTAVGKTDFCVQLAQKLNCDIFSADSRQFYKEMSIGTAKPTAIEMRGVKHHFIDSHSILDDFSAGDFERQADNLLEAYFKNNPVAILTGGSGLFVKALLYGLDDMPSVLPEIREKYMKRLENEGIGVLQNELKEKDPDTFQNIDIQNSQRVVRALEVCEGTGRKFSSFKAIKEKQLDYEVIKIGLERPREELYDRINRRVDLMLEQGLLEEVERLKKFENHNALQTVGYKEVFGYFKHEYDYQSMVELLKRNTRRYAKRQLTWFKNQDHFEWFDARDPKIAIDFISQKLLEI